MTKFEPKRRTIGKAIRHINYTCDPIQYANMEKIAEDAGISLKELLRQMVDFSIEHM